MIRVSSVLANYDGEFREGHTMWHWCPACSVMHPIPHTWKFTSQDRERPSFTPSFLQYPSDPKRQCHYVITDRVLHFSDPCHHRFRGAVSMVVLTDKMLETV